MKKVIFKRINEFYSFIENLEHDFDDSSSRYKRVVSLAVNKTVGNIRAYVQTGAKGGIPSIYYIKKEELASKTQVFKAKASKSLVGGFVINGEKSFPLYSFGPKANIKTGKVSVKTLKNKKKAQIQSGGDYEIAATKKKKRAAVWISDNKEQVYARNIHGDTITLFGPSFMSFFKRKKVIRKIESLKKGRLYYHMNHEAKAMIKEFYQLSNFGRDKK